MRYCFIFISGVEDYSLLFFRGSIAIVLRLDLNVVYCAQCLILYTPAVYVHYEHNPTHLHSHRTR